MERLQLEAGDGSGGQFAEVGEQVLQQQRERLGEMQQQGLYSGRERTEPLSPQWEPLSGDFLPQRLQSLSPRLTSSSSTALRSESSSEATQQWATRLVPPSEEEDELFQIRSSSFPFCSAFHHLSSAFMTSRDIALTPRPQTHLPPKMTTRLHPIHRIILRPLPYGMQSAVGMEQNGIALHLISINSRDELLTELVVTAIRFENMKKYARWF